MRFRESNRQFRTQFCQAWKEDGSVAAVRCAHTLKGTAANIGASGVQDRAAKLERACGAGAAPETIDALLEDVVAELFRVEKELEKIREEPGDRPEPVGPADESALTETCDRLRRLLEDSDAMACSLIDETNGLLRAAFPQGFPELADAIRSYDFDKALGVLDGLLKARRSVP